jgi:hypothetical protein
MRGHALKEIPEALEAAGAVDVDDHALPYPVR